MVEPFYPRAIECLLPVVDGWTPITAADLNMYQAVLRRIEEVLGAGPTNQLTTLFGPKSGNASVAARLNEFLEEGGTLVDIAFVTGTERLGAFAESGPGAFISFGGKSLSRAGDGPDSYFVLFAVQSADYEDVEGQSYQEPSREVPACWWTRNKLSTGVWIQARTPDGIVIDASNQTAIPFALLAIGYDAVCTG